MVTTFTHIFLFWRALSHPLPFYISPTPTTGGAWKGQYAEQLALEAIKIGYRAFDSANCYLAAYNETAFGAAFAKAIAAGQVTRKELFIQTKFTPDAASECEDGPWDPRY